MSVIIPNMEMPKDCGHCRFAVDGWCYAYGRPNIDALSNNGIANFCPLVPLPEGHGRLGDLDAPMNNIGDVPYKGAVRRVLMSAPTIVPAEGGGEDG